MSADQFQLPSNADKFWERPPAKEKGNESPEPIWQAIGSSLTTWEMLESTFSYIFRFMVESKTHAAARAYGAIASARGRRDAMQEAAEVYFTIHDISDELKKDFKLLLSHFDKASGRRNEIAHGVSVNCIFEGGDASAGNFLIPADYNSRKTQPFMKGIGLADKFSIFRADYRYTAEDISFLTSKFHHLNQAAMQFLSKLAQSHPQN